MHRFVGEVASRTLLEWGSISQEVYYPLFDQFMSHIERNQLFSDGERLIVGFSSGPDSLALLTLLCRGQQQKKWHIAVAHVDHQLRPESIVEAERVRDICARLDIECYQERVDVAQLAKERKLGIEEAGRFARYSFLLEAASRFKATAIVFGHQADDQLEHFWMRAIRGASVASLAGMPAQRVLQEDVRLVRPLLPFYRQEIEIFLADEGLEPYIDMDNFLLQFDRNRVRHELVPLLTRMQPRWKIHVQNTMQQLADDESYFQQHVLEAYLQGRWDMGCYSIDYAFWCLLPKVIRSRLLMHIFRQWDSTEHIQPIQYKHVAQLESEWQTLKEGSKRQLPGERMLQRSRDRLYFCVRWPPSSWGNHYAGKDWQGDQLKFCLPWLRESTWQAQLQPRPQQGWHAYATEHAGIQLLASHFQRGQLVLRSAHTQECLAGDRRTLNEIMQSRKIPLPLRSCYPVLACGDVALALLGIAAAPATLPGAEDPIALVLSTVDCV